MVWSTHILGTLQMGMLTYPFWGSLVLPHSHDPFRGQRSPPVTQLNRRLPLPWPLEKEEGTLEDGAGPQLFIIIIIIIIIIIVISRKITVVVPVCRKYSHGYSHSYSEKPLVMLYPHRRSTSKEISIIYPPVNVYITMENHHLSWVDQL